MHSRIAIGRLRGLARQFPAVQILGARQVGKSTLARQAFPDHAFFDLEKPADLDRLRADPWFVLSEHPRVVLDEAQRAPELFPLLRSFLDEHPRHRIVLLGSASPHLVAQLAEALTGRVGIFDLGGLSVLEEDAQRLWLRGAFPRVHWSRPRARPDDWYPSYLRTSLERDIPQLGFRVAASRLRALLTMVAHGHGGLCNLSELGASLGVSYHSVSHIVDIFEGVFLLRRLQPYHANVGKRLVKAPKVYLRDTGILHSILGMGFSRASVLAHPKAGASFEGFCIEQLLLHARLSDPAAEAFFYRTHTGVEVDLLLQLRGRLVPIEIKLGVTPPDTRPLETCMADLGLTRGYVLNLSAVAVQIRKTVRMCGLFALLDELDLRPRSPTDRKAR